ncbi:MAG: carbon-nitrogen hydrolase family protein [Anaerolineales bacterium]|nr:carbon-nitrogen hydrolase family protein [Anaerolineales bacterium]
MIFNVALLQMASLGWDQQASLEQGDAFCRLAKEKRADIALFPELWNVGYTFGDFEDSSQMDMWRSLAIDRRHPYFIHFRNLAKELNMAIALTYLEIGPDMPYNAVSIINRHGKLLFTYRKVHTCDFDVERALTPGDSFQVGDLQTEGGTVRVGTMICFDREFPEAARILMLRGGEVILTPNACDIDQNRKAQFQARAFENMVGVAMANYVSPKGNGHSIAFDGQAFDEEERSLDMKILEAGEAEGVFVAAFDLNRLRAYREREVWGNAYRKPRAYPYLTSIDVDDPFIRKDARRLERSIAAEV